MKKEILKQSRKATKGITLVALVVTIVVLLILAGLTLVYVFGDNSVFKQASEAKLKTDIANWQERLEMAKSPVFIEGLGTFDPDKYFNYIQQQGIINNKDTDVIDNEDGTYDVTTKPGYVFLVTLMPNKEKPTDVEIEYLGEKGKLQPKLKRIIVTGKTKTSLDIKVSARLEGGEIKCYYKKASEVAEGEAENNIEGYIEVTLDENLIGSITGLTAGESYKIKAVLQKDGEEIGCIAIEEKTVPLITVTSITLDKETATIAEDEIVQLTATVKPDNAEDKSVAWSSSNTSIAAVDQTGKVTGVAVGTATITVTANDGSGISASCELTVVDLWAKLNRIAKAIANDNEINSGSSKATGKTEANEDYSIEVGDIFYVKYNGERRSVRVLGFKYDDLVNTGVYGGNHKKASITFDFVDFITGTTYMQMNTSDTNSGGWVNTKMRKDLNGYTNNSKIQNKSIGGLGSNLSNKNYIKQVQKVFIPNHDVAKTDLCNDYLWLLSATELWNNECFTIVAEGSQYPYYKIATAGISYKTDNSKLMKGYYSFCYDWWLRTPRADYTQEFLVLTGNGNGNFCSNASDSRGVAPGFCI